MWLKFNEWLLKKSWFLFKVHWGLPRRHSVILQGKYTHTHTHTQKSLSRVRLFVTPWIVAHQTPPSMGFSRQGYWIGVPLPSLQILCRQIQQEKTTETIDLTQRCPHRHCLSLLQLCSEFVLLMTYFILSSSSVGIPYLSNTFPLY